MLETYLNDIIAKESNIVNVLREASSAIQSIKSINENSESETLIPMGIGAFVKAKILPNEKVVLNLGAGAAIEKDKASAINYLEARIKEIEMAIQDNSAKKHDAAAQLEQGKKQINQLMQAESQSR